MSGINDYLIQQYSPTDDMWSTLSPAPVRWFGMGELNGQLVIVGGKTRLCDIFVKLNVTQPFFFRRPFKQSKKGSVIL